jgi:hypothetical protein
MRSTQELLTDRGTATWSSRKFPASFRTLSWLGLAWLGLAWLGLAWLDLAPVHLLCFSFCYPPLLSRLLSRHLKSYQAREYTLLSYLTENIVSLF